MIKKNQAIVIGVIITVVVAVIFGIGVVINTVKEQKYEKLIDQGKTFILDEENEEAMIAFEKARTIMPSKQEAGDLIALVKIYKNLNNAFAKLDGQLVRDLVNKINKMEYFGLIKKKVNAIDEAMTENINLMNEIDSFEIQVPNMIEEKKFDKALGEIERYQTTRFNAEYTEKLVELDKKVVDAKVAYEEEQRKILEKEKIEQAVKVERERILALEAEKKKEEELKKQLEEKDDNNTVVKKVYRLYYYDDNYNIYYVDKELEVKEKAVIMALTNGLKEEPPANSVGAMKPLNSNDTVRSARVDNSILYINLSKSVNETRYGSGFESTVISCLVNTYGYNLGVNKVNISVGENEDFIGYHHGVREFSVNVKDISKLK